MRRTRTQKADLVECLLEPRASAVREVFSSGDHNLASPNRLRACLLSRIHRALELGPGVCVLSLVLSLALEAELVALALLNVPVDLAEGLRSGLGAVANVLGGVGEGEAHEGGKIVEDGAALLGEVLPNDGDEGAEGLGERVGVLGRLVGVDVYGGCGSVGEVSLREVPERLLDDVVACEGRINDYSNADER